MSSSSAPDVPATEAGLRRLLAGLTPVDEAGTLARVARLAARAAKGPAKAPALETLIRLMDLTTLEGRDTARSVAALCARAQAPQWAPICPPSPAPRRPPPQPTS